MRNLHRAFSLLIMGALFLCIIVGNFQVTQAQQPSQPPPSRGSLNVLTRALADAGAPELTSEQEEKLTPLIQTLREQCRSERPEPAEPSPKEAYENAILASDLAAAQQQATLIANQFSARMESKLKAGADAKIQALAVLSDDQKAGLSQRIGTAGVSRVLDSLFKCGKACGQKCSRKSCGAKAR